MIRATSCSYILLCLYAGQSKSKLNLPFSSTLVPSKSPFRDGFRHLVVIPLSTGQLSFTAIGDCTEEDIFSLRSFFDDAHAHAYINSLNYADHPSFSYSPSSSLRLGRVCIYSFYKHSKFIGTRHLEKISKLAGRYNDEGSFTKNSEFCIKVGIACIAKDQLMLGSYGDYLKAHIDSPAFQDSCFEYLISEVMCKRKTPHAQLNMEDFQRLLCIRKSGRFQSSSNERTSAYGREIFECEE